MKMRMQEFFCYTTCVSTLSEASYIKVKVSTSAKRESIRELSSGSYAIAVREKAQRGMANKSVLKLLRRYVGGKAKLRIVRGHHTSSKMISVEVFS
ncbi:MAG TPA: DUF167 domain-containing protein [Candidatus Paceibacterota bacterium]